MLQIGVGHKADDGVEGQGGFHSLNPVGIQKRDALDAENDIADGDHRRIGADKGQGVLFPVHPLARIDPAQLIKSRRPPDQIRGRQRCVFPRRYDIDTVPPE